jgi:toxin CcdB
VEDFLVARFDVYPNPGAHAASTPYLLDIQNSLFDGLDSRVVIPLRVMDQFAGVKLPTRLTPILQVSGKEYLLETPKMGAVPRRVLKDAVTSLADQQDQIAAALDFLFHGY